MRERESERTSGVRVRKRQHDWNSIEFKTARRSHRLISLIIRIHIKEQKRTHCKVGTMPDGCTDRSIPPSVVSVAFSVATMGKGAAPSSFGGFVRAERRQSPFDNSLSLSLFHREQEREKSFRRKSLECSSSCTTTTSKSLR